MKKIILSFICITLSVDQLQNSDLKFDTTQTIATTAIITTLAYAAYHQFNTLTPTSIPTADTTSIKSIIFDIDGVLTKTNKLRAFYEIDWNNDIQSIIDRPVSLLYIKDQKQLPSEAVLFDALANVPAVSSYTSYNKGLQMPQIMIDWQTGAQTLPKIRKSITDHFEKSNLPESQKFWALQSAMMMTNPEKFIATRQTISETITLLHELKEKGYKLYILSNWDAQSFPLFQEKFSQIFVSKKEEPIFDGIMISGHAGIVKPETILFEKCLKDFNLNPDNTIFIDDEPANIIAAQKVGIKTVHADPSNPQAVRKDLINLLQS